MKPSPSSHPSLDQAFSLVELLVTLAIVSMLMGLVIPAFSSFGKSNALSISGNHVVNLANRARANSMAKNVMTALILNTDPASQDRNRSFALWELPTTSDGSTGEWRPISDWQAVSPQIVAENSNWTASPAMPVPAFSEIQKAGKNLRSYQYLVFLPDGSLLGNTSAEIRLVEGNLSPESDHIAYTGAKSDNNSPANYYKITILALTGRTRIDRP